MTGGQPTTTERPGHDASSYFNKTDHAVVVYKDIDFGGDSLTLQPGDSSSTLPEGWGDDISSAPFTVGRLWHGRGAGPGSAAASVEVGA